MSEASQPISGQLSPLGRLTAQLAQYRDNATHNLQDTFTKMTIQSWIRVLIIVGGYMLLRPYLLKFAANGAIKQMEAEDAKSKAEAAKAVEYGDMLPNDLRGVKEKIEEVEEKERADGSGADWGQRARAKQRLMLKHLLEEEEKRRAEQEDDADIQEFLHD